MSETTLQSVSIRSDILPAYRGTPVEVLLACHNLREPAPTPDSPQLIVVTCMDHRIELRMPPRFAFVVRSAGANAEPLTFNLAAAMAVAGVRAVVMIGHSDCAMVDVERHRDQFIQTMTTLGTLDEPAARAMFDQGAETFGVVDPIERTLVQCEHLATQFSSLVVAPLWYDVETGHLDQIIAGPDR